VKRAPDNVRYPQQFGKHILTQSFTARDPKLPFAAADWNVAEECEVVVFGLAKCCSFRSSMTKANGNWLHYDEESRAVQQPALRTPHKRLACFGGGGYRPLQMSDR
jgi:hypothetical protein